MRARARDILRPALGGLRQGDAGGLGRHPCRADAPAARLSRRGRRAAVRRRHHRPSDGDTGRRDSQSRRARGDGLRPQRGPRHLARGPEILAKAARHLHAAEAALDIWGDVTFNYASTDTPDFVPTVTAACEEHSHAHHAGLLFVPARPHRRADPRPGAILPRQGLGGSRRIYRRSASPEHILGDVGTADVRPPATLLASCWSSTSAAGPMASHYIRFPASTSTPGWERVRLSFIVNRPKDEPGFRLERTERPGRNIRVSTQSYAVDRPEGERYAHEPRLQLDPAQPRRCHASSRHAEAEAASALNYDVSAPRRSSNGSAPQTC